MAFEVVWVSKPGTHTDAYLRVPVAALHASGLLMCDEGERHSALDICTGECVWAHDVDEKAQWVYAEDESTRASVKRCSATDQYEVLDAKTGNVLALGFHTEPEPVHALTTCLETLPRTFQDWFSAHWFSKHVWIGYQNAVIFTRGDGRRFLACVCETQTKLFLCDVDALTVSVVHQSVNFAPRQFGSAHAVGMDAEKRKFFVINLFTFETQRFAAPVQWASFYAADPVRSIVCLGLTTGEIWCVKINTETT